MGLYLRLALFVLTVTLVAACSSDSAKQSGGGALPGAAGTGTGTGSQTSSDGTAAPGKDGRQIRPDAGGGSSAGTSTTGGAASTVASGGSGQCGVFSARVAGHIAVDTQQQVLVSTINVHVEADVAATITGDGAQAKLTMQPSNVQVNPALAQGPAETAITNALGERTFTYLSADERKALAAKDPAWAGIDCAVIAVKSQTIQSSDGALVYEYTPALPLVLDIGATADALSQQLAQERSFKVTGTVKQSPYPDLPAGTTASGTVSVKPAGGAGAYTVTPNFGSEDATANMGLFTSLGYGIDTAQHNLATFSVSAPLGDGKDLTVTLNRQ